MEERDLCWGVAGLLTKRCCRRNSGLQTLESMLETSDDLLDKSKLVRPAAKPRVTKGKIQIDTDWYIYRIFELLEKISSPFGLVVQRLTRICVRNEKILGSIPRMGTFFVRSTELPSVL